MGARSTEAGSYRSKQKTGNLLPLCREAVAADLPASRLVLMHDCSLSLHDMFGSLVVPFGEQLVCYKRNVAYRICMLQTHCSIQILPEWHYQAAKHVMQRQAAFMHHSSGDLSC